MWGGDRCSNAIRVGRGPYGHSSTYPYHGRSGLQPGDSRKWFIEKGKFSESGREGQDTSGAADERLEGCWRAQRRIAANILEEVRERFSIVSVGRFEKTTTGWPRCWRLDTTDRKEFFTALRFFAGIAATRWGRLLTPLVNGIRIAGPFQPTWATTIPNIVVFDTEGLGHKADASADLPDHLISMFNEVDSIVLVHSAKSAMDFSVGKALEALVSAGQTKKTIVAFTHMDDVHGPNLRGRAKNEHAFNNLRNIVENQLAKSLPSEVVRFVTEHLEHNVFYLGKLNEATPLPA